MSSRSADLVNRKFTPAQKQALIAALCERLSPERVKRLHEVLGARTRRVTLVLEDIFEMHNAAACLRTCEAFGVQDAHFIINRNDAFAGSKGSGVSRGSEKWLCVTRWGTRSHHWKDPETAPYPHTQECLNSLKEKGYRLVATTLRADSVPPENIPTDKPIALLIGSEHRGLSQTAHDLADMAVQIPMVGFVQSLNLSVCAAMLLRALTKNMREQQTQIGLSEDEKRDLLFTWLCRDIAEHEEIAKRTLGDEFTGQ